jgi:hypothetical protein
MGSLAAQLSVDRAGYDCAGKPCWSPLGDSPPSGKGYSYKDTLASASGVTQLKLRAGWTAIRLTALNHVAKGREDLPAGIASALSASSGAILQFRGWDASDCFSMSLPTVRRSDGTVFEAIQ